VWWGWGGSVVHQRGDDARPGGPDGVAESHRAAADVDLLGVQAHELVVGERHDAEGLVDLWEGRGGGG
jgi:hypothetical protein